MLKTLGFLALFGALIALTPVPASAAADGARNTEASFAVTHDEISARRYLLPLSLLPAVSLLLPAALLTGRIGTIALLLISVRSCCDKGPPRGGPFCFAR